MIIIEKEEHKPRIAEIKGMLKEGKIFVYPTDTIYGIGCDATNDQAVKRVRKIKERPDKPFSVIAPSKEWIKENCHLNGQDEEWLGKIPGPYTLILNLKNKEAISSSVNDGMDTIGVRMPDHWILDVVSAYGKPIITPSANVSGREFMTSKEDMDPQIRSGTNVLLYEGEKKGQPSTIVNLAEATINASGNRNII
jgi:L-threonylcarbamoyladenylate synthase